MANKWQFRFFLALSQTQRKQVLSGAAEQSLRAVLHNCWLAQVVSAQSHTTTQHITKHYTQIECFSVNKQNDHNSQLERRGNPGHHRPNSPYFAPCLCSASPRVASGVCLLSAELAMTFLSSKSNIPNNKLSGFRNFPCFVHSRKILYTWLDCLLLTLYGDPTSNFQVRPKLFKLLAYTA